MPSYDKLCYPYYAYSGYGILGPKRMDEKVVGFLGEAMESVIINHDFIGEMEKNRIRTCL